MLKPYNLSLCHHNSTPEFKGQALFYEHGVHMVKYFENTCSASRCGTLIVDLTLLTQIQRRESHAELQQLGTRKCPTSTGKSTTSDGVTTCKLIAKPSTWTSQSFCYRHHRTMETLIVNVKYNLDIIWMYL